jgi:hypothetical protein
MHHYITRGCFGSSGKSSHQLRFCQAGADLPGLWPMLGYQKRINPGAL